MTVGVTVTPIYRKEMPSAAWQLLWWLIWKMDAHCEVSGGWRAQASRELGKDRTWIGKCAESLTENGLIETSRRERRVRVLVANITA